jgi:hypothetical protein
LAPCARIFPVAIAITGCLPQGRATARAAGSDAAFSFFEVKFSIITPSFRNSQWLKLCVASVADQQSVAAEHIVQDAGSDDGTLDWLTRDRRVQAYVEKDKGMYDAVNRGNSSPTLTAMNSTFPARSSRSVISLTAIRTWTSCSEIASSWMHAATNSASGGPSRRGACTSGPPATSVS